MLTIFNFNSRFAKNFIDIREREMNADRGGNDHGRQLMNLHNHEAGRRVGTGVRLGPGSRVRG